MLTMAPAPTVRPPSRMAKRWPISMAMGVISFAVGASLINAAQGFFPRRVVLETSDAALLFAIVLVVCLLASGLGVRTALKIDPASALAG